MPLVLDLNNMNPGTEFDFGDGIKVKLRACSLADWREIDKVTSKEQREYKKGLTYVYTTVSNQPARNRLVWDKCIVDWSGIITPDNAPIPCTTDNKILLMENSPSFAAKVIEAMTKLQETPEVSEAELETKN